MTNEQNILIATVLGGHKVATGSDGASFIAGKDGALYPLPDYETDWASTVLLAISLEAKKVEWSMSGGDGVPSATVNQFRSYSKLATTALAECLLCLAEEWS